MSYCVECGVELAEYHKKCPLCGTPVINPKKSFDFSKNEYPVFKKHHSTANRRKVARHLTGFILTMCFLMVAMIPVIIDFHANSTISWSIYPLLSSILFWVSIALPFFKKRTTFFKEFTITWAAIAVFCVLLNLVTLGQFMWARYAVSSMALIWVLMAGIFIKRHIRRFVPVVLVYILTAVGYFMLIASWIANTSAVFSLVLPLEVILVIVFLVSFFLIKSKLHGAMNFIILFLTDILIVCVGFDLTITRFFHGNYAFTWSFIVTLAIVPMILVAIIIHKRLKVQGVLSKKLHR
ncbi:MAG: zinc ribbon domain-containing protein [Clostridiales bacterium]|nr:zinc ribbon domain-containing protein [Clostridiales bacterium]